MDVNNRVTLLAIGIYSSFRLRAIQSRAHSRHWCQLNIGLAVETAAIAFKTRLRGLKES